MADVKAIHGPAQIRSDIVIAMKALQIIDNVQDSYPDSRLPLFEKLATTKAIELPRWEDL